MSQYGPPDDPSYYSEQPTEFIPYGQQPPPEGPEVPWYRKPWALVGFGVLGALLFVLIVYLIFGGSNSSTAPVGPVSSTLRPATTTTPTTSTTTETTPTTTTTTTPTTTTTTPTTTESTTTTTPSTSTSTSTTVSVSTSTSTVTLTVPGIPGLPPP